MSNSADSAIGATASPGRLLVEGPHAAAQVAVYDGSLRPVARGVGGVDAAVAAGLYKVEADLGGRVATTLVDVGPDATSQIGRWAWDLRFDSPAPLLQSSTAHEYYSNPAMEISRRATWRGVGGGSQLFVFVRVRDEEAARRYRRFADGLRLLDGRGRVLTRFRSGVERDERFGWLGGTLELAPGPYVIATGRRGRPSRFQPLWLVAGFQTQLFVPADEQPDLSQMALSMAPVGAGFRFDDDATSAAELVLDGLQRGLNLAGSDAMRALVLNKVENPWLAVLAAHALRIEPDPGYQRLVERFLDATMPDHPDWRALKLAAGGEASGPFPHPPQLWSGFRLLRELGSAALPPGSLSERVLGSLLADSPWTAWSDPRRARRAEPPARARIELASGSDSGPRPQAISLPAVIDFARGLALDDPAPPASVAAAMLARPEASRAGAVGDAAPDAIAGELAAAADQLERLERPDGDVPGQVSALVGRIRRSAARLAEREESILVTNARGDVLHATAGFEQLVGYGLPDLLPSGPADTASIIAPLAELGRGRGQVRLARADGGEVASEVLRVPIEDPTSEQAVGHVTKIRSVGRQPLASETRDALEDRLATLKLYVSLLQYGAAERRSAYLEELTAQVAQVEELVDST